MTPFPGTLTTQITEHHFTTKTGRDGCQRSHTIVLTPEQKAWFVRWFPTVENDRLMQASGMRFGIGFELKDSYFNESIRNVKKAISDVNTPTLFSA